MYHHRKNNIIKLTHCDETEKMAHDSVYNWPCDDFKEKLHGCLPGDSRVD